MCFAFYMQKQTKTKHIEKQIKTLSVVRMLLAPSKRRKKCVRTEAHSVVMLSVVKLCSEDRACCGLFIHNSIVRLLKRRIHKLTVVSAHSRWFNTSVTKKKRIHF